MDILEIIPEDMARHCLARLLQCLSTDAGASLMYQCMYCRYAPSCNKLFQQQEKPLFMEIVHGLEKATGVDVFMTPETSGEEILAGSWMEDYPGLMEKLKGLSIEEQWGIILDSDILEDMGILKNPGRLKGHRPKSG